ncbi:MAG: hypothetical protein VZQ47_07060 [Treponema sp.]|nr:hypothetical protein [Treponema sp.]MEE3435299.1 hypothetical protein [Treponema sp.]
MALNFKDVVEEKQIPDGFIKVTDRPVQGLSSEQKAILNRRGNVFFNNGDIESARRVYLTTGYSDGLIRVGDEYAKKKQTLKALKMYTLAHNTSKVGPIYEKIAATIGSLLKDDQNNGEQ